MNIIELAKEAGFKPRREMCVWGGGMHELENSELNKLKRFAALVRAETIMAYRKGALDFQEAGRAACERIEQAEPVNQEPVVDSHGGIDFHEWLDRKLAQVRAKALEEAAKVCEEYENRLESMRDVFHQCEIASRQMGAKRCAAAIRGLK